MVSRWRTFHGSQTQAFLERERLRDELKSEPIEKPERETLQTFARSWLSTRLARGDWRETTARRYAESLDLHILPRLGHVFIDALKPREIEEAIAEWATEYQRATVNSWLRVMRTMLSAAVTNGIISTNPAMAVRALRERRDDDGDEDDWSNAFVPSELHAYLGVWRERYPEHFALIATLAITGLRWGEATALMWTDIEAAEQHGVLRVRRSHVRGVIRKTTKTGKRRLVPFPVDLANLLNEHRRRLVAVQHPGLVEGWVFPNAAGKPLGNGALADANQRVLKHAKIGKHVTIHGLRRTATDLLRRAAVDPVAAKAIIGHTTDRMREHYSTVNVEEARDIGQRVVSLVPGLGLPRSG
jgi:integrase